MTNLIVIPARGGSKGIPRKNLRILGGKPLLQFAIEASLGVSFSADVVITSDDHEILHIAQDLGCDVVEREPDLCRDDIPLDPVICDAFKRMSDRTGQAYENIITIQPTSPFVTSAVLDTAFDQYINASADTLFSVVDNTHLSWSRDPTSNRVSPNFEERLNRQWLPQILKETGSIQICSARVISEGKRIGERIELFELDEIQGIDIDTPFQWTFCESIVKRKKWVFVVVGDHVTGLGHAFRVLALADWLASVDTQFLCLPGSELAQAILKSRNYPVALLDPGNFAEQIISKKPDIIVNDILDTEREYISELKASGAFVVNFEDCGSGIESADLVINALYHHKRERDLHIQTGEKFFCLRNEFRFAPPFEVRPVVSEILLTFGGTDPNNLSLRVLEVIAPYCEQKQINISVIVGPGYGKLEQLDDVISKIPNAQLLSSVRVISKQMANADICFTSCGRTIYELASLGVPTICIAQNDRELLHTFARQSNGIEFIGAATTVTDAQILNALNELESSFSFRRMMSEITKQHDLTHGCERIIKIIQQESARDEGLV